MSSSHNHGSSCQKQVASGSGSDSHSIGTDRNAKMRSEPDFPSSDPGFSQAVAQLSLPNACSKHGEWFIVGASSVQFSWLEATKRYALKE